MDLPSPKLYRSVNASKIKLFKDADQMSLLPNLIKHLLCLKEIALETAAKIETASLFSYSNLKRPASNPPVNWISSGNAVLSRTPKKTKDINYFYLFNSSLNIENLYPPEVGQTICKVQLFNIHNVGQDNFNHLAKLVPLLWATYPHTYV
ncbi:uncharacterized protein EV154DRAFT_457252 [Mucor mucedo]|uniref:uncharacterized protein n=1 Tax=Mucor mucedo TaxID=29922 RepID=UPI00221F0E0B|nr:uncharacterized protein EV154DRAFT_457252 [Mucor mucedo]KAI7895631.1 hypothetical protein EV154DRAFT_457252 [Mucor mucedo]